MGKRDRIRGWLAPVATRSRPASPGSAPSPAQPISPLPPSSPAPSSIAPIRVMPALVKPRNQALEKAVEWQLQNIPEAGRVAFEKEIKTLDERSLLSKVQAYDEEHKNDSSFRCHAESLTKGLELISDLMKGVAIGIQSDPVISSPVVGALRVVIDLSLKFSKFFTRLTDMIYEFEVYLRPLSRLSQAADIEDVEHALVKVYLNLLDFGWRARCVFVNVNGEPRRFTSFRAFKRQFWDTFETEFMAIKEQMQHHIDALQLTVQAEGFNHARTTEKSTERTAFLSWVSDVDFEEVHQSTYAKKHRGTGDWLTREPQFQEWMQSSHSSLLWCNGKPGIGKSVLSSHVLEHITAEAGLREKTAICFAYYNYRDTRLANITTIIATLIKQLCQGIQNIPDNLLEIMRNARSPSLLGSKEYFFSLTENFSEVFVVFDALDECPEERREDILDFITEVVTMLAPHRIKVFATSRREMDITTAFEKEHVPTIQISADSVAADIETFARSRVEELRSGQHGKTLYISSDDLKEEIISTFAQKADGMFLWVNLQLENLCQASKARNDEVVKEALNTLPRNLPDTYIRILERIETQSPYMRDLAIRCLSWVIYAQRPLITEELQTALAINSKCKTQKDLQPISIEVILEACGNLLEEANGMTRPIHYTVQEFLTTAAHGKPQHAIRRQLLDSKSVHKALSLDCLMYINLMSFSGPTGDDWKLRERVEKHDLATYAYTSFDYHILNCGEPSPDAMNKLESLFQQDSACLAALLQIALLPNVNIYRISMNGFKSIDFLVTPATIIYSTRLYNVPAIRQRWVGQTPPIYALHLAASAGLVDAIWQLLVDGVDINKKDGDRCTSMYYACRNGHLDIAQILVREGADIHAQGGEYGNALQAASYGGHEQIVQMLLDAGANVNASPNGYHGTALQAASYGGREQIVQMLLDVGANVNASSNGYHGTALQAASNGGHEKIVQMLLDVGADVNAPPNEYHGTALQTASNGGHEKIVQMLLDAGADVNAPPNGYFGTALQTASYGGHEKIVQMLLNAGANVNAPPNGYYGTALQAASYGGHEKIVQMLLDAGADVNAPLGGHYDTALQAASYGGREQIVQMLLNAGADVNAPPGGRYGTALQAASRWDHEQIVQILLDVGANVNASPNGYYGTALQAASYGGREQIVQMLLAAGADVNLEGGEFGTALQAASSLGRERIVQMLLAAGAHPLEEEDSSSSSASSDDGPDESPPENSTSQDP